MMISSLLLAATLAAFARTLSTGVEIPDGGVPVWDNGMQYTTRMEARPIHPAG